MSKESYEAEYTAVAKAFCKKYGYEFIKADPFAITLRIGNGFPPINVGWYNLVEFIEKETDEGDN